MRGALSRAVVALTSAVDRARSSLFFVPALFVVGAVGLAVLMLYVDGTVDGDALPAWLRTTVASGQTVMGTITAATITVAGIAFSLTLVSVQLASSQLSPRVLRHFLRDRFQQAVMGLTVGTFTYGLIVLRATRAPFGNQGSPVTPHLSVAVGVVLGVATVLAILAFIDHGARAIQAGRLIGRIADETLDVHRRLVDRARRCAPTSAAAPEGEGFVVCAEAHGWVQQISDDALFDLLPEGGTVRVETHVGAFVGDGDVLATLWPAPEDPDRVADRVRAVIYRGPDRTMQEDLEFGIRQMVDVALRALSPGVNDPTTAYEVIVHLGAVMAAVLEGDPPPVGRAGEAGRRVLRPRELGHEELLDHALGQLRVAAAPQPHVCVALVKALGRVHDRVRVAAPDRAGLVEAQARLIVEACAEAAPEPLGVDLERVVAAAAFAAP